MKKSFLMLVCSALICVLLGGCSSANSEKEESAVRDTVEVESENNTKEDSIIEGNTSIVIKDGMIIEMYRRYMP